MLPCGVIGSFLRDKSEQGVTLISGSAPQVFALLGSGIETPYAFMESVLLGERYEQITA